MLYLLHFNNECNKYFNLLFVINKKGFNPDFIYFCFLFNFVILF